MKIKESEIPSLIIQGRDKEAIDSLYKNVLPKVKKYILRNSGTSADAEDIFQDAVVAFYQSIMNGKFNMQYKIFGFIYKACVFRWINKGKKDSKTKNTEELDKLPYEINYEFFMEESEFADSNVLSKLFSGIGNKCLELLNYAIYKEMLIEDIAIRMNFPSSTAVSMQISRCKEKLIKELEKNPVLINKLKGI